jgi:hypothetical protein
MGTRSHSDWVKGGVANWDWLVTMHKEATHTTKTDTSPCMCPFQTFALNGGQQQASMHSTLRSCMFAGVRNSATTPGTDTSQGRDI